MGYNTTVVVLNDALHQIREDKDFGRKLADEIAAIDMPGRTHYIGSGSHANVAEVIETHHADGLKAVLIGGNTGYDLGFEVNWQTPPDTDEGKEILLRRMADHFGIEIAIKKKARGRK